MLSSKTEHDIGEAGLSQLTRQGRLKIVSSLILSIQFDKLNGLSTDPMSNDEGMRFLNLSKW